VSFNRLFGAATVATVIAGVALAFTFLGTPRHQRLLAIDERRVEDLQRIASLLHDRYPNGGLPNRLSPAMTLSDPATKRPYEYDRIDANHYVLCAEFTTSEVPDRGEVYPAGVQWVARDWRHGARRSCFKLDVTASPPEPPETVIP
jgi:hypothetical protein